jgi:iron complex transport system permease protein
VTTGNDTTAGTRSAGPGRFVARPARLVGAVTGVGVLALLSLFVGVIDVGPGAVLRDLTDPGAAGDAVRLLLISRLPRTVAVVLTGAALAVVGLIMQMLARNRFVEPSTIGTVEWASLGLLGVTILTPALPVAGKLAVASACALIGTAVFLRVLRAVPLRDPLVVPLVGLMLSGIVGALATFVAFRYDLLQSLGSWTLGDFSGVLRGRYELLWLVAVLAVVAYVAADRFTVAGMGQDVATNLGLNHTAVLRLGLSIVAVVTAVVVVVVGAVPFLGLVVPNLVSLTIGDDVRRGLPWVAVLGAGLTLAADLLGRVVRFPYEIPVGVVMGVLGSGLFLWFLLRKGSAGAR